MQIAVNTLSEGRAPVPAVKNQLVDQEVRKRMNEDEPWIDWSFFCLRILGDPDNVVSGGKRDYPNRDVPKYTQIGNAVPVRLAYEIGKQVARLLKEGAGRK